MKKKIRSILIFTAALILSAFVWVIYENGNVKLTEQEFKSVRIPKAFDGFTIAHVSDLHGASFGKDQERLITQLRASNPDIIAVTGDIIDSRRLETEAALTFAEKAVDIAPVYYAPGNHEARIDEYPEFEEQLKTIGVIALRNETVAIERGEESIKITGIDDPLFIMREESLTAESAVTRELEYALDEQSGFTLLLSHRPELIETYASFNVDLALSGHAHGGQIRLPSVGGIYAPGQGFLPKYTEGEIRSGNTSVIVSRGLGNSIFPFRINNDPEIVFIRLKSE